MGMSTYILDRVDEYYNKASAAVQGCEHFGEFATAMQEHAELLQGSGEQEHVEDLLYELWQEHCSNYC